jgi:hypothetical protein
MNPFSFFLAIADKVHTALNLLDPTRTYAAADALWARQRGAGRGRCAELLEEIRDLLQANAHIGRMAPPTGNYIRYHCNPDGTWNAAPELVIVPESSAAPASQTDTPGEASGVPEGVSTPDPDAPSGHLTLGNDPGAVHERALRQRREEDRTA